jgi:hypothetical protein
LDRVGAAGSQIHVLRDQGERAAIISPLCPPAKAPRPASNRSPV